MFERILKTPLTQWCLGPYQACLINFNDFVREIYYRSKIRVTTGLFEPRTSYIQGSYASFVI